MHNLCVRAISVSADCARRTKDATEADDGGLSLRSWAARDFDTWQDRLSSTQAALQILLPIAAAAIGMTVFGIVFHIAAHGA